MTKEELLGTLVSLRFYCSYLLVTAGIAPPDIWANNVLANPYELEESDATLADAQKHLNLLAGLVTSDWRSSFLRDIRRFTLRAAMREAHDAITSYCKETNQCQRHKGWNSYWFAHILRNSLSHTGATGKLRWPHNIPADTCVKWRHRNLTREMRDQEIEFSLRDAFLLLEDMYRFVDSELD